MFAEQSAERTISAELNSVDGDDDVGFFEAGGVGGAVFDDFGDISAEINWQVFFEGGGSVDGTIGNASVGAGGGASGEETFKHALDAGNRDGEPEAVAFGDSGVDADDFAGGVDERAARVARVDGGVGLYHVGQRLGVLVRAVGGDEGATSAANDARGDAVLVLDRKSTRLNSSHPTTSRMPSSA